jgi:antitoxin component of MazEF toxin-antitoxin module|tara:strand:- start:827 stop:991 length:165 start_codon:yes stop_codon:yes gene_type:complete
MHRFTTKILEDDHTGDLYVILPDAIFAEADLMAGDEVEYSVDNETILLEKTNNE